MTKTIMRARRTPKVIRTVSPTAAKDRVLRKAVRTFLRKLDAVIEDDAYRRVWAVSQNVLGPYEGLQYINELVALRKALEGR